MLDNIFTAFAVLCFVTAPAGRVHVALTDLTTFSIAAAADDDGGVGGGGYCGVVSGGFTAKMAVHCYPPPPALTANWRNPSPLTL